MKKEDLIALGVTEDLAKQIMALHGADMTKAKAEDATKQETINDLKQQLSERDKDLKKIQKDNSDNEDLKNQITDLQTQYKALEKSSDEKVAKLQRDAALDSLLGEFKPKNAKAVKALLDNEKISFSDGQLQGAKEQLEALKGTDAYLFDLGVQQAGYNPAAGNVTGGANVLKGAPESLNEFRITK